MDAKPQLFLSSLPLLTDYVTILGEVTTSGPHLLNCACCRALLRRTHNVLSSPAMNDKKHVYIVAHKNDVKKKEFSGSVTACNLKLVKVMQLTNSILQYCLDFTLHTYLHPHWTRVDNKYLQGSSCLFQNRWMGCIRAQLNVQAKSVIIAIKATQVKLLVARLSTFHIRDDTIQRFMKKDIRTIISSEMGDNTCYVLPSFKPALVHSISYDIDKNCPLKDKSDMMAYWLDYHGMLIPSDTDIFVTLSFNFPGAPTMTYPYYCIRKSFPVMKQGTDAECINDFVIEVNNTLKSKLPNLQLHFPISPAFYTGPDKSKDCLVAVTSETFDYKSCKVPPTVAAENVNPKMNILPLRNIPSPKMSASSHNNSAAKIKPRFTPYQKPLSNVRLSDNNNNNDSSRQYMQGKVVPSFRSNTTPAAASLKYNEMKSGGQNIVKAVFGNQPKQSLSAESMISSNNNNSSKFPLKKLSQSRVVHTSKSSWSDRKLSQSKSITLKGPPTPCSVPSSFEQDDFDDFEIPQSLKFPSPKLIKTPELVKTPETTPMQNLVGKNYSPACKTPNPKSETRKKTKASPKIVTEEQIKSMLKVGNLSKVNNQSLIAFLKKQNVKGAGKFKKDQLVSETLKILGTGELLREL